MKRGKKPPKPKNESLLVLWPYQARERTGAHPDLRDGSCRPDPDFDSLTLGLCRPAGRSKILKAFETKVPVYVCFCFQKPRKNVLTVVAVLRVRHAYPEHDSAARELQGQRPLNLMVNPSACLFAKGERRPCACDKYERLVRTPYIVFRGRAVLRRNDLSGSLLARLAPALHDSRGRFTSAVDVRHLAQRSLRHGVWLRGGNAKRFRNYLQDVMKDGRRRT